MNDSRRFVETAILAWREGWDHNWHLDGRAGPRLPSPYEFLIAYGKEYSQRIPSPWRGEPKACYYNARKLARQANRGRSVLRYCEGYACSNKLGLPLAHAWCVDQEGRVIDPTWDENPEGETGADYFGIALRMKTVAQCSPAKKGCYAVLGNWMEWPEVYSKLQAAGLPRTSSFTLTIPQILLEAKEILFLNPS